MKRCLPFFVGLALPISAKVEPGMALGTIQKLQVQRGVHLHIQCASTPRIEVVSANPLVSKMDIYMQDQTLVVDAKGLGEPWVKSARMNLFVAQPISGIEAKLGVDAVVDACAVAPDAFAVVLGASGKLQVSGSTKALQADLAQGGFLNYQSKHQLQTHQAKVTCEQGCKANLSGAKLVRGLVALGGEVIVGAKTQTQNLRQGQGGHITR